MKPLLAQKAELHQIKYPVYATPKLDGIRCIVQNGVPLSRKLKILPNRYVQEKCKEIMDKYPVDGEIIIGQPNASDVFQKTTSGVMSFEGQPDFRYYVFDAVIPEVQFRHRLEYLESLTLPDFCSIVPTTVLKNEQALLDYEVKTVQDGYEGIMIRSIDGMYKFGRSTVKEGYLLKIKRFDDFEATIVGFTEKMHNDNELERDELGYAKRSSKKAGKRPAGTLGALVCQSEGYESTFEVGSGYNDEQRQWIWDNQTRLMGEVITVKCQKAGEKDKPRFPVFKGFRWSGDR